MAEITDAIKLHRVKQASEAYKELKSICAQTDLDSLLPKIAGDELDGEEPYNVVSTVPTWPEFRDAFIADWAANRTIVTDKEADAMFERDVEEAIAAIEATETPAETVVVETPAVVATPVAVTPAKPKRVRNKVVKAAKTKAKTAKAKAPAKAKTVKTKVAAKKKSGGSASAKAQTIIAKYAERDWSRKDIIAKLQEQLGMGVAYASTLYQKFA